MSRFLSGLMLFTFLVANAVMYLVTVLAIIYHVIVNW